MYNICRLVNGIILYMINRKLPFSAPDEKYSATYQSPTLAYTSRHVAVVPGMEQYRVPAPAGE